MIAYAIQVGRPKDVESFRRFAAPGLRRIMEPGDRLRIVHGASIHEGYNQAIDWARRLDGLEALVLLHADAEVLDEYFPLRLRSLLKREPWTGLVGVAGAKTLPSLLWWDEPVQLGGCFHEEGAPFRFWTEGDHEAAVVDGVLMAIPSWSLHGLRFDTKTYAKSPWYAYDCDLSKTCTFLGWKVFVMDTRVKHHTKGGIHDLMAFKDAYLAFREKWRLP